jgi:nickel/cobalt transporter (NicO) family protein
VRTVSAVLLIILVPLIIQPQTNPFLSAPGTVQEPAFSGMEERSTGTERTVSQADGSPAGPLLMRIIGAQRTLQRSISASFSTIAEGGHPGALWALLFLSFVYGFLHALGPGHRKTVLLGYFVGEETRLLSGLIAGMLLAAVHAGSAIILVGGLAWIAAKSLMLSVNQAQTILLPLSYAVIVMLGLWMLIHGIRDFRHHHRHTHHNGGLWGIILSGVVPCPGASAIMIFALASNAFLVGTFAVLAMSLGIGLLLAGIGIAGILFRSGIARLLENEERGRTVELVLHTAGGLFIAGMGLLLLLGL